MAGNSINTNQPTLEYPPATEWVKEAQYLLDKVYPILKWGLIIFLAIYLLTALIVIKQIKMMTETLSSPSDKYLIILGYIHLGIVIALICFAVIAL